MRVCTDTACMCSGRERGPTAAPAMDEAPLPSRSGWTTSGVWATRPDWSTVRPTCSDRKTAHTTRTRACHVTQQQVGIHSLLTASMALILESLIGCDNDGDDDDDDLSSVATDFYFLTHTKMYNVK